MISLRVYFKSVKKWKDILSKKNKTKQDNQKTVKKSFFGQCFTYCAMSTNVK